MPTLLSLAGLNDMIPSSAEGRDLSPVILENGKECDTPDAALYIRNVNGPYNEKGLVEGFFPAARGIKTDRYTFEIAIKKDGTLSRVLIFDDINDPYQLNPLDYKKEPETFAMLLNKLDAKLEEANDIWHRENRLDNLKF